MIWNLTLFFVHVAALAGAFVLYRKAPCWMQRLVMAGLIGAMTLVAGASALNLAGVWWAWRLSMLGLAVEHIAVLLYVFRLNFQGESWKHLSQHSQG